MVRTQKNQGSKTLSKQIHSFLFLFWARVIEIGFFDLYKIVSVCHNVKGLIGFIYLNIPNQDENIFAPKKKDCG